MDENQASSGQREVEQGGGEKTGGEETVAGADGEPVRKRKRIFSKQQPVEETDPLPSGYQHIRLSERKVDPRFYQTCAALTGNGLSIPESIKAIIEVGNRMFERNWKTGDDSEEEFDLDTAPSARNVRTSLQLQEIEGLARSVEKVQAGKSAGRAITHEGDSTTKKGAGQFIVQGLSVGQETRLDLPILPIFGETTEDIALQCDMGMEILAACKGTTAKEIYRQVDVHMSDSTQHNKGIAPILAELYDLEKEAGQIFCNTHTTLGFSAAMNKVMRMLEAGMKLEEVVQSFMVNLEQWRKVKQMQPMSLCIFSGRQFEDTFDNAQWRKVKQMQPM